MSKAKQRKKESQWDYIPSEFYRIIFIFTRFILQNELVGWVAKQIKASNFSRGSRFKNCRCIIHCHSENFKPWHTKKLWAPAASCTWLYFSEWNEFVIRERSLMTSLVFWLFLTYLSTLSYSITFLFWGYLGPPYLP